MNLVTIPRRYATRAGIRINQPWLDDIERIVPRFHMHVDSGYRTVQDNRDVGGALNSDHLRGDAADFTGTAANGHRLWDWANDRYPYVEPLGESIDHVHISFRHGGRVRNPPPGRHRIRALSGWAFVRALWLWAAHYHLDPVAMAAVGLHEGASGEFGDHGTSFGPWMLHIHGALPAKWARKGAYSEQTLAWAWSRAGIRYTARMMATVGCAGLSGHAATHRMVYYFEHPAANLIAQEAQDSANSYDVLIAQNPRRVVAALFRGPHGAGGEGAGGGGGDDQGLGQGHPGAAGRPWTRFIHSMSRHLPAKRQALEEFRQHIHRRIT
jgi:hypothetical protein